MRDAETADTSRALSASGCALSTHQSLSEAGIGPVRVAEAPASAQKDRGDERPSVELVVVIPTFNERDNVNPLLGRLETTLQGINWEVIFVDDDSPDGTAEHVRQIALRNPHVRVIQRI